MAHHGGPAEGEARANMSAGAGVEAVAVDETILRLCRLVGPRLAADGMFLVGLDIVGDRILEIHVFSPGGFGSVRSLTGVDFTDVVLAPLEERTPAAKTPEPSGNERVTCAAEASPPQVPVFLARCAAHSGISRQEIPEVSVEAISARLAGAAAGQQALISLDQMTGLKITRHQREHLLASGQIVRVAPRVYLLNGAPFTWRTRIAAARLGTGSHAIVSHRSAAALYGLDGFDQQRIVHLSVPVSRRPSQQRDVRIHRVFDYELIRPHVRQGIPVTDPARLVLDLYATERNVEVARRGLFSARKKRLVTWTTLEECLKRHARQGRRGITRLRADLEMYRRTGCPENLFEDALRAVLTKADLPEPTLQHWVATPGGLYRIDVAYPECRVGVEGKSRAHHLTDEAFEADPARDADLAIAGWILVHVTWARLHDDPAGVVRQVRRALLTRGALLTG